MMTLLSLTIRELGSSMLPDTGRGEMHHKPFKWASQHTNQRGDFIDVFRQVRGSCCVQCQRHRLSAHLLTP